MARKKAKIAFIENYRTRKATYEKRKTGLLKKIHELSTLCGIHASAIIFSPFDPEPLVWTSTLGVQHVIAHFKRLPEMEQAKRMLTQETFLRQRIANLNKKLMKQRINNREKMIMELMRQYFENGKGVLQNLMSKDLNDLGIMIENKLKETNERMETINNMAVVEQVAQPTLPQQQTPTVTHEMPLTGMQVEVQKPLPRLYGELINCPILKTVFSPGMEDQIWQQFGHNQIWQQFGHKLAQ